MFKSLIQNKKNESILAEGGDETHGAGLKRVLSVRDLTFFGIAANYWGGELQQSRRSGFLKEARALCYFYITGVACGFTASVF